MAEESWLCSMGKRRHRFVEKHTEEEKVLDIALFILFSGLLAARYTCRPQSLKDTILEFPACSYLGAVPIVRSHPVSRLSMTDRKQAFDGIIEGLVSYYGDGNHGQWAAFILFWISVVITVATTFGLLIIQFMVQSPHSLVDVAGM